MHIHYRCVCPEETTPPFCKYLSAQFTNPGWMWLGTARLCPPVHISLEFRSKHSDGTLLYAGPRPKDKGGGTRRQATNLNRRFTQLGVEAKNIHGVEFYATNSENISVPHAEGLKVRHHHLKLRDNLFEEVINVFV